MRGRVIVPAVAFVAHVITGLSVGGAEMVLWNLLRNRNRGRFASLVVSLGGEGPLADPIRDTGCEVVPIAGAHPLSPSVGRKLSTLLAARNPDLVQTWMYHGDLMGGIAARASGVRRVVWGLHAGPLPPRGQKITMKAGIRLLALLSRRVPTRIVCCSHTSKAVHASVGYDESKMVVVPNGFPRRDVDPQARTALRGELHLPNEVLIVGRVGRLHPQKDLRTLLSAFALVPRDAHLVLVGPGYEHSNQEVARELRGMPDLRPRIHLLGERRDITHVYAGSDLIVSSSAFGEALPMVLGEAMAYATPVVTTDVGDSARLVGDPRRVVPPRDPVRLGEAMRYVLTLDPEARRDLGKFDRIRVYDHYSIEQMVSGYEHVYASLLDG